MTWQIFEIIREALSDGDILIAGGFICLLWIILPIEAIGKLVKWFWNI